MRRTLLNTDRLSTQVCLFKRGLEAGSLDTMDAAGLGKSLRESISQDIIIDVTSQSHQINSSNLTVVDSRIF